MPKVDDIGFGPLTHIKMEHLSKILEMHLVITSAVLAKNPRYRRCYRYVDLTAGKGSVPDGTKGSPVVFLEEVESGRYGIPFRADFIERMEKNLCELKETLEAQGKKNHWHLCDCHYHPGTYQTQIKKLFDSRDPSELGLVFVDPSGDPPDLDTLKYIAEFRPRMEILLYLSTTNIKRLFPYRGKLLSDYMKEIGKTHWLIRKPIRNDRFKWTFLLGSSASNLFKDYKKIDFLRLDSVEAQEFFPKLNLSTKQRQAIVQPKLL